MKNLLIICTCLLGISASAQTTWYEIPTGTDTKLNVIDFADGSVGYIGGEDSLLLKTSDSGKTWNQVNFTGVSFFPGGEDIVNLKFVSADIGYMTVGPYGGTYKTMDGGQTWTSITFVGTMCYNQGLYFWDENNGVFGGSGCFQGEHIEVMTGGNLSAPTINTPSWTAQDIVLDVDFLDADFGLAVSPSRFLRTTDGGANWDTIPSGTQNPLTSIVIINDTLAYAGYKDTVAGFGAMMTTDGGLTWSMEMDMATFFYPDYNDVGVNNAGHIFSVGGTDQMGQGIIFENKNDWWNYYTVDHHLFSMDSYGDSTVFAVGDSGLVVTNTDPALLSTNDITTLTPSFKVFPNPANDVINIALEQTYNNGQMTLWDLKGRVIYSSIELESSIDIHYIESGVYVLEIIAGDTRMTQRFIKD